MRLSEKEYADLMKDRSTAFRKKEQLVTPAPEQLEQPAKKKDLSGRQPNKTEAEYCRLLRLEFGVEPRYEAITLRLENGHRYTADWVVAKEDGGLLLVEVKNGGYKHASYGRSKMAFAQARLDFPIFSYRWVEKNGGAWTVS